MGNAHLMVWLAFVINLMWDLNALYVNLSSPPSYKLYTTLLLLTISYRPAFGEQPSTKCVILDWSFRTVSNARMWPCSSTRWIYDETFSIFFLVSLSIFNSGANYFFVGTGEEILVSTCTNDGGYTSEASPAISLYPPPPPSYSHVKVLHGYLQTMVRFAFWSFTPKFKSDPYYYTQVSFGFIWFCMVLFCYSVPNQKKPNEIT